ncbi:MAG TPA: hypothetical protein DEB31_07700 [Clostridiales bacterium]|nr:hypothetical protein [Clostridiales bacterium]
MRVAADEKQSAGLPHMRKRIGSTVYEVNIHFNQDAKETMDDKILRLIRNDLNKVAAGVNMAVPQTSRLPERSSAA